MCLNIYQNTENTSELQAHEIPRNEPRVSGENQSAQRIPLKNFTQNTQRSDSSQKPHIFTLTYNKRV